ncbi:tetratricopeptide repeat-containing sensor histidine kinase [Aquimarina litoralis]
MIIFWTGIVCSQERLDRNNIQDSVKYWVSKIEYYNNIQSDSSNFFIKKTILHEKELVLEDKHKLYQELDRYYAIKDQHKKRRFVIEKGIGIAKKLDDPNLLFHSLSSLGSMYTSLRLKDSALIFFNRADSLLSNNIDPNYKFKHLVSKGLLYSRNGNLEKGLNNYLEALNFIKEKKDSDPSLALLYNNIGSTYFRLDKNNEAIDYFYKSYKYSKKSGQYKLISMNLYNISSVLIELEDSLHIAKKRLKEALVYAEKSKSDLLVAKIYNNNAVIYEYEKDYNSAIVNNKLAIEVYKSLDDLNSISLTLQNLTLNYVSKRNLDRANFYTDSVLKFVESNSLVFEKPYAYELKSSVDSITGNYESSLKYYKKYIFIRDSLNDIKNTDKLKVLQTKFATLEKDKKIASLKGLKQSNEIKLAQQKLEKYILLATIGMVLIISFFVFVSYIEKRKMAVLLIDKGLEINDKNQSLIAQSISLEQTIRDKETLLQEIYHRVKNNLQLVSSMLNLQAEKYDSEVIDGFVSCSQDRILSVSLVHQIMYEGDNIEKIDFHKYLERLMAMIVYSPDDKISRLNYKINAEGHFYGIDIAIPLGIIINELIHNSINFAFIDKEDPEIIIKAEQIIDDKKVKITIQDNGEFNQEISNKSCSGKLQLVNILIQQIKGTILFNNIDGTEATIEFAV